MSQPRSQGARPRRGNFHGIGVSACVVLLLVLLLELAGAFVPALSPERLDPEVRIGKLSRVQPHPYLAYSLRPGFSIDMHGRQVSHNSMGFRGPEIPWKKPEGVFRIACLGGSSTYGHGPTRDSTTWPARLQDLLNEGAAQGAPRVEVINAGCTGWSTFESLINLELRVLDLEPDLVLVYHAINDMRCALYGGDPQRDNTHWRAVWPRERPSALEELVRSTTSSRLLRSLDRNWSLRRSSMGYYVIRDFHPSRDDYVRSDPPEQGFLNMERNLVHIAALARAHGAQVAFVTQGVRLSQLEGLPSGEMQAWGVGRALQAVRTSAASQDVPVIEAAEVLEATDAARRGKNGGGGIFTDEVHLSDEGADLLARTIEQALRKSGAVPGR